MNEREFVYWLNGFIEMTDSAAITESQWVMIKDHLKLVMNKVTPEREVKIVKDAKISNPKEIDWRQLFPQTMFPKIPDLVPKVDPWEKRYYPQWWDDKQKIWLHDLKVTC